MDPKLQKLIHQLQDEKCPPSVLDHVAERISHEKALTHSLRSSLAWALSIACLLSAAFWQWQTRHEARLQAQANRAQVMQQTQQAFGYIGLAFIRAAAHTENALSKGAVPPLRNSFEIVKNKVTDPI